MNNPQNNIDEYLAGLLDPSETRQFEKALDNPDFASEVTFHKELVETIEALGDQSNLEVIRSVEDELDRGGFFSVNSEELEIIQSINVLGEKDIQAVLKEVDHNLESDAFFESREKNTVGNTRIISINRRRRWMAIAASLLVLVFAGIVFWPQQQSGPELFANYYEMPSDAISAELIEEKGELGFADNRIDLESLENAMNVFLRGSYSEFLETSADLISRPGLAHYRDRILFYRGIAYLENNQYQDAIASLSQSDYPEASYYQVLAYLAMGDVTLAQKTADQIEPQSEKLQQIMSKIRD